VVDLTPYNTLRTPAQAENLVDIISLSQLENLVSQKVFQKPFLLLGSGANVLFTKDFPGTVYKINFTGIEIVSQNSDSVLVKAQAGQDWHQLVMWTVNKDLSGLENMAFIPGTVGAAVVGNIAAYGQNQESVLESVTTLNLISGETKTWSKSECKFSYRESIFKQPDYKKFIVVSATYRLSPTPHIDTTYHASRHASLLQELERIKSSRIAQASESEHRSRTPATTRQSRSAVSDAEQFTVRDIAQAVINLRTAKLPDPAQVGTAGSFFKNPIVPRSQAEQLKKLIPDLQTYPADKLTYTDPSQADNFVKLPAGMLLDELGWKGKTIGSVSTSPNHALNVINLGGATGQEIFAYSETMRQSVKEAYGIDLEYEVIIL
jgi:UDP-N-acetylmuramate dehydrogenase